MHWKHVYQVSGRRALHTTFGPLPQAPQRRVVITGLGAITPLGVSATASWENLINGYSGIKALPNAESYGAPSRVAAYVCDGPTDEVLDASTLIDVRDKRMQDARFMAFAMAAASEALLDAGWRPSSDEDTYRAGVAFGSGIGNLDDTLESGRLLDSSAKGYRRMSPYFVPRILINMAAGHISIKHKLKGPNHSCVTACATGAHSIGDAFRIIRHGDADVMVAGASEASINPISMAGFSRLKALSTKFNDEPSKASRPFDKERDGFVIGEGAGAVVLEEFTHAKNRGAKIYAEIRGYGMSGDAFHITQPSGDGAFRAMRAALHMSGLTSQDVGYVNAHATSTPLGDRIESETIESLFGRNVAVSSTKGATGHLLGAAGAVEAIFTIKAIEEGLLPPTLNLFETDISADVDFVALKTRKKPIRAALSNSFGFGGTNASLLFAEAPDE